jgi:hypothetical protein
MRSPWPGGEVFLDALCETDRDSRCLANQAILVLERNEPAEGPLVAATGPAGGAAGTAR